MKGYTTLLLFLCLAISLAACGPSEEELNATTTQFAANIFATQTANAPTHTATPIPTFTPTPTPTPLTPETILENALNNLNAVQTYHYQSDIQSTWILENADEEMSFAIKGDFQAPDRTREMISMNFNDETNESEFITIGNTTYLKDPDTGEWEIDIVMKDLTLSDLLTKRPGIPAVMPADIQDLVLVEETHIDGNKVQHLSGRGSLTGTDYIMNSDLQVDYWIGVDDGLLKQSSVEGELVINGDEFLSELALGQFTIDFSAMHRFSDFGKLIVIEAPTVEPWIEGSLKMSEDRRRAAYGRMEDEDYFLVVDQTEYGPFDGIGSEIVVFSPDGQHMAYFIYEGDDRSVVIDNEIVEGPYQAYGGFTFSPDSQHYAYRAVFNGKDHIVIDGVEQQSYDQVDNPHFSPDSQRVLYSAREGDTWFTVLDGEEGKRYEDLSVRDPGFSPDSKKYTALASRGGKFIVIVDGIEGKAYDSWVNFPYFSPDSQQVVYAVIHDNKWYIIKGQQEIGPYEILYQGQPIFSPDGKRMAYLAGEGGENFYYIDGKKDGPYQPEGSIVFSPDSQRIIYFALEGEEWFAILDGERIGPYQGVTEPVFSGDSKRVGYVALLEDKAYAFIDQDKYGPYDEIGTPIFSPDSQRFAFAGKNDGKYFIVVDGIERGPYELTGFPVFSPDSRRLAYAVMEGDKSFIIVDDWKSLPYDRILDFDNHTGKGIIFEDDDHIRYLALLAGEIILVEEDLK